MIKFNELCLYFNNKAAILKRGPTHFNNYNPNST